jgi:hypothetical protein
MNQNNTMLVIVGLTLALVAFLVIASVLNDEMAYASNRRGRVGGTGGSGSQSTSLACNPPQTCSVGFGPSGTTFALSCSLPGSLSTCAASGATTNAGGNGASGATGPNGAGASGGSGSRASAVSVAGGFSTGFASGPGGAGGAGGAPSQGP